MLTMVVVLRTLALLASTAPMLLRAGARHRQTNTGARGERRGRTPVAANFCAVALFAASLVFFSGRADTSTAVPLASSGFLLALVGAALVLRSRSELGAAWSLVAKADRNAGLVTTGPYRVVRHPIYLGFVLLATGQALAFANPVALGIVLLAMAPTFAWRARAEEVILGRTFGEPYVAYRQRTRLLIPYVL